MYHVLSWQIFFFVLESNFYAVSEDEPKIFA